MHINGSDSKLPRTDLLCRLPGKGVSTNVTNVEKRQECLYPLRPRWDMGGIGDIGRSCEITCGFKSYCCHCGTQVLLALRRDPPVATNNGRQRSIAMHREGGVCTIGLREGRYTTELRQKSARVYNCLPLSPKDCHRDQLNISADSGAWIMSWVVTKVIGLAKSHCI